ncbi:Protein disulfide-isomerase TMX3 [Fukomys damarensis]|uniref:Protein disulfide-isomerase TMX3 n=1 Tax=Fukomys damarensis TaxID=885580 RepID=A0A091E737_FUKDA|nr:Protein disulfide-isomerase TMX3 [Fukomys damarensis]
MRRSKRMLRDRGWLRPGRVTEAGLPRPRPLRGAFLPCRLHRLPFPGGLRLPLLLPLQLTFLLMQLSMASVAGLWSRAVGLCTTVLLLDMALCKGFVEDLDESFKENRKDDIWLVDVSIFMHHGVAIVKNWNQSGMKLVLK